MNLYLIMLALALAALGLIFSRQASQDCPHWFPDADLYITPYDVECDGCGQTLGDVQDREWNRQNL